MLRTFCFPGTVAERELLFSFQYSWVIWFIYASPIAGIYISFTVLLLKIYEKDRKYCNIFNIFRLQQLNRK